MNVRSFNDEIPQWLAASLEDFEREFTYPLGDTTLVRISHGTDYLRFFRAMGECACAVAEKDGKVLGTVCGAIQTLTLADGSPRKVLYTGDLKITAAARGTRVLLALARSLETWGRARADAAYSVVMDGTSVTPAMYTGRAGLPAFLPIAKIAVLRIPARLASDDTTTPLTPVDYPASKILDQLRTSRRVSHLGGVPSMRSASEPRWLTANGAIGRLEDTGLAKKQLLLDGAELASAHLSCFHAPDAAAGARFLSAIGRRVALAKVPAFFTAVPSEDQGALLGALQALDPAVASNTTVSPATVFATGIAPGAPWLVNTAEI